MFKVAKDLAPTIINDLFPLKEANNHNLKNNLFFKIPRNETLRDSFESICLRLKILGNTAIRNAGSETVFEIISEVKSWNPIICPCELYKMYIKGVGYA